ncbi:hypothetical protein [Sphingobacterium daejeonense]|nr:hypothetical protein [Sphingobacterium daejeonense]
MRIQNTIMRRMAAAVPDTLDWEAYDYDEENTVDTIILARS